MLRNKLMAIEDQPSMANLCLCVFDVTASCQFHEVTFATVDKVPADNPSKIIASQVEWVVVEGC
jgi:hypothetical protein